MSSNRRKPPDQSGGGGSWMDTYGDMVTLLLTFFVLLFSFSTIDAKKWEDIVNSFTGNRVVAIPPIDPGAIQAQGIPDIGLPLPTPSPSIPPSSSPDTSADFDALYYSMNEYIQSNGLGLDISVEKDKNKIVMRIKESVLFRSGKADILPEADAILIRVNEILERHKGSIHDILIEGHTDDVPINTAEFPSNWELSSTRALHVMKFLLARSSIDPSRIGYIGRGEFRPIAPNDEEGRPKNRRVDFVLEGVIQSG